jgi:molybdopterin molybdotransferase
MPDWGDSETSLAHQIQSTTTEDLIADRDYPPFNRATMDGIAISWKSFKEGLREFLVSGICAAGTPQKELTDPRTCFEIMTGAPVPTNADLIIPYEEIKIENGKAFITKEYERPINEFIHAKGSDITEGAVVLEKGHFLNGPAWGIAASVGRSSVKTQRLPRIQIISTGDELVDVNQTPLEHQIRRSNAHALQASLKLYGYNEVNLTHLSDNVDSIKDHYEKNKTQYDILIFSGGVSKGKYDYLPEVWKASGVTEYFHGVSQRPGKPLWFGVDEKNKTAVLGLPGNPVSSLVCLHRYFLNTKELYAELTEEFTFKKDLTYFLPVKIQSGKNGVLKAHPLKIKNSGEFTALAGSDGILELPKEKNVFSAGEVYRYFPWRPF